MSKKPKSLNVAVTNRDALLDVTLTVTGKWTHTADEVIELAARAEETLDRMWMPMGKRKGIIATHIIKGPTARAYRFAVNGSMVTLRRAVSGWRVIGFAARNVYPQQGGKLILQISPEQEAAAVESMRTACGIVVRRPVMDALPGPAALTAVSP